MKKLYGLLLLSFLCTALAACAGARGRVLPSPSEVDRTAAVIDIIETERSKMELPETSAVTTEPHYYEVVAVGTTAATTAKKPKEPEKVPEYFTVKFVDTDGYTAISVQTVMEGEDAAPPVMPKSRGDLIFRVNVEIPKGLSEEQKEQVRAFAGKCHEKNYAKKSGFFKRIFEKFN